MIYKGFTIQACDTIGGVWAIYARPDEEYCTCITRTAPYEAVRDAKRQIDEILQAEKSATALPAWVDQRDSIEDWLQ
jgi:hypothetical protein